MAQSIGITGSYLPGSVPGTIVVVAQDEKDAGIMRTRGANDALCTATAEYEALLLSLAARYADGRELVIREDVLAAKRAMFSKSTSRRGKLLVAAGSLLGSTSLALCSDWLANSTVPTPVVMALTIVAALVGGGLFVAGLLRGD